MFTTTNRRVGHHKEIDILAFDSHSSDTYHIEVSVTFRPLRLNESIHKSSSNRSRDSLDYFLSNKFDNKDVKSGILEILGRDVKKRILVVGKIEKQEEAEIRQIAERSNLEIMLINDCINELKKNAKSGSRDDAVRTIELATRYSTF